jgi:hypothetical protein
VLLDLESHQILNDWGSSTITFLDSNTWKKKPREKDKKNISFKFVGNLKKELGGLSYFSI